MFLQTAYRTKLVLEMETRIQENLDHETETLYMAALSENVEELDPLPPFCCFIPTDYVCHFLTKSSL